MLIRARKPWVRERRRLLGWNVRLLKGVSVVRIVHASVEAGSWGPHRSTERRFAELRCLGRPRLTNITSQDRGSAKCHCCTTTRTSVQPTRRDTLNQHAIHLRIVSLKATVYNLEPQLSTALEPARSGLQ